ncbi:sulfurtransferase [Candidatus Uhrbacteria bacterium CG10_big_fil_rev_8_21_14_0_10_50_16]|uniref:Sulfurtransferase n=1 Tax=Candidatus Uhrbacteria bacterium CG10_big_fil_rev_8_21_14_0_10_50_16 TaxID=1975039 RepID=A0A2H0RMZ0_9BACT|nr:MAG: sulfurtransferase [Candidatus Uhrbacteria bacterium CG10_big_fil_rev_8_21_14_0_10_50_16]
MTGQTGKTIAEEALQETPSISCDEYKTLLADDTEHVLLDVREEDEWNAGHIENAMHIPRGFLEFKVEEAVPDKGTRIIVYCARGGRAALAGQTLLELGYTHVQYLDGGYMGYCQS